MRSRIDLHVISLALAGALLGGCGTGNVNQYSGGSTNEIYYSNLQALPEGASATIRLSSEDGTKLTPDLRFEVSELPVQFRWPDSFSSQHEDVRVHATLELGSKVLAQARARTAAAGSVRMQLESMPDQAAYPGIADTRWRVVSYGGRPALDYTDANIQFGADGQLFGNGGCNQYQARYASVGSLIEISPLNATRKICFSSVMYQEHSLFKMLAKVTHLWLGR